MAHTTAARDDAATAKRVRARFDRFELDEENAILTCDGKPVALAPTPFAVLCALVRQNGALLTKNALLDEVWGHRFVTESVLKTVIGKLRTALQDDARQPRFIETVSRRGYRFIATTLPVATARPGVASDDIAFIGREDALSRLHAAWDRALLGQRAIFWIAGDPGIGKTTLIERFVATLGDVMCVRGQCVEQYGSGEPYLPVLEALGDLCRRDPAAAALMRAVAPAWLLQLPWLSTPEEREALRRELAGFGADRMLRELAEFFDRYTERRPLLVITEDLHWSDRATVRLLDYLSRRHGGARAMWLATFRLSEVIALDHPLNPLRRELRLHGLCEEIVLDPFSESEVSQYVARRSPSIAADEGFVRLLHERTDGVPLFVAHVMSDVVTGMARGGQAESAAARVATLAVPDNLAAIIDHYIGKLGTEQRTMLSAAAVCGTEFRVDTLAGVMEADAATVGQACEELVRQQLWLRPCSGPPGAATNMPYSFRHALFRQVLYERIAPAARAQLHRKVGSALERERAAGATVTAAELAMHFDRGDDAKAAARYYVEAAKAASLQFSPGESLMLAERGLTLLERIARSTGRDEAELSLATLAGVAATHLSGISSPEAKTAFMRAERLLAKVPAHPMREVMLHAFGLGLCLRADYAEALSLAERTLALESATKDPAFLRAACVIHGEVDMLQGHPRVAREWVERGLAGAAAEGGSMDAEVTMLGLLALQLLHLGLVEGARQRLSQAHQRAREARQPMAQMTAIWLDALVEVRLGDAARVGELGREMGELVEKFTLAQGRSASRWFRGWALARAGEPRDGYRLIRDAYEDNTRMGMRAGATEVLGYAAEALLLAGDLDAAEEGLREAFQIADTLDERIYLPQLLAIEASIARERGKPSEAEASLRRALAEAREQQAPWLEFMALTELCASSTATKADREALAATIGAMPEAKDTQAVKRARALLEKR